jgi:site-specific recombinase XerD
VNPELRSRQCDYCDQPKTLRLQCESPSSLFVSDSERGSPFATAGFARVIERDAAAAGFEPKAQSYVLRHAHGYAPRLWNLPAPASSTLTD